MSSPDLPQCVILAGGLGTRMRPLTSTLPKALIPVGGRPFADWQLEWLATQGVHDVVYSVGHLGTKVEEYVGDGSQFGLEVVYVHESEPVGTGGALRLAADNGRLDDVFTVLYGDSYLPIDLAPVVDTFMAAERAEGLMTVFRNDGRLDQSNVVFHDGLVTKYEKGCADPPEEMSWIDYGLSVLRRSVVDQMVPTGVFFDLAQVLTQLSAERRLAGYEMTERFYEVGSLTGLADLEQYLAGLGDERVPSRDPSLVGHGRISEDLDGRRR